MASIIQLRTDNEAQWILYNPVLAKGELAISDDTVPRKFKVGDGVSAWSALDYFAGLTGEAAFKESKVFKVLLAKQEFRGKLATQ